MASPQQSALLLVLACAVAGAIVGAVLIRLVRRWQWALLRRERGEQAPGFPVKLTDTKPPRES